MKKLLHTLVVCALAAVSAAAQSGLSGTWQIEYHDTNGKEIDTPMVTLLQNGGRLDGVFGNQHWKVEGAVVGDQVQFSFHPPQRPDITVRYQGTLESSNQMRGTMASEVQSGTFVAVRK
jgi:opacity protein-like surface antigen